LSDPTPQAGGYLRSAKRHGKPPGEESAGIQYRWTDAQTELSSTDPSGADFQIAFSKFCTLACFSISLFLRLNSFRHDSTIRYNELFFSPDPAQRSAFLREKWRRRSSCCRDDKPL
jgi:hypothetical protein